MEGARAKVQSPRCIFTSTQTEYNLSNLQQQIHPGITTQNVEFTSSYTARICQRCLTSFNDIMQFVLTQTTSMNQLTEYFIDQQMQLVNHLCGDYLELKLVEYLGIEEYRRIANTFVAPSQTITISNPEISKENFESQNERDQKRTEAKDCKLIEQQSRVPLKTKNDNDSFLQDLNNTIVKTSHAKLVKLEERMREKNIEKEYPQIHITGIDNIENVMPMRDEIPVDFPKVAKDELYKLYRVNQVEETEENICKEDSTNLPRQRSATKVKSRRSPYKLRSSVRKIAFEVDQ